MKIILDLKTVLTSHQAEDKQRILDSSQDQVFINEMMLQENH